MRNPRPATMRKTRPAGLLMKCEKPDWLKDTARLLMSNLPSCCLEVQCSHAADEHLDHVRRRHDLRALDQLVLGDATRLGAGAARPDLAAIGAERLDHLAEGRKALFMDLVGVAPRRQPDPINCEQQDDILIG